MVKHEKWTDEEYKYLLSIKDNHTYKELADMMTSKFNQLFTPDAVRGKLRYGVQEPVETPQTPVYKETIKINADGSQESDRLVRISQEQSKNPTHLLKAHGYDPNEWTIVNSISSIWNQNGKETGMIELYASKITVKPRIGNDYKKLLEVVREQKPIIFNRTIQNIDKHYLLEIAPVDTHFGISSYEYYIPNQQNIIDKIQSRYWSEIVIPIGNDLFHNDDFRGRTSSGREIQKVSMDKAWGEAKQFYYPIIEKAIKQSNKAKVIYVKGNHDESMSWAFVDNLITKFPQIDYDAEFEEHKTHIFHGVFLGYTHGDKNRKNIANIFNSKFRMEVAKAKVREIHIGHLHGEDVKDDYGIMVRTLPTRNKEDEWHDQNGYVGKNKRFQVFEYSEEQLESIHYV